MPVQHRGKQRVPVDLEPALMEHVAHIASTYNIPRTKLLRVLIKYGISNLELAIKHGDSLSWSKPPSPSDISCGQNQQSS